MSEQLNSKQEIFEKIRAIFPCADNLDDECWEVVLFILDNFRPRQPQATHPTPNTSPQDIIGVMDEFRRLKGLRNNRHMDEPDFDEAVAELIDSYTNDKVTAAEQALNFKLHSSIMSGDLKLGNESDQAFNYGRIHSWIDRQLTNPKQETTQ